MSVWFMLEFHWACDSYKCKFISLIRKSILSLITLFCPNLVPINTFLRLKETFHKLYKILDYFYDHSLYILLIH